MGAALIGWLIGWFEPTALCLQVLTLLRVQLKKYLTRFPREVLDFPSQFLLVSFSAALLQILSDHPRAFTSFTLTTHTLAFVCAFNVPPI